MKTLLRKVLEEHDRHTKHTSLRKNLGDGYLFKHNPVFRNVRQRFLGLGYRFTNQDFCDYRALAFAALPEILAEKRVPFYDNYSGLAKVEKKCPGSIHVDIMIMPTPNYLLHESCHCIGDAVFEDLKSRNGVVLRGFLCESLANSTEVMARLFINSEVHRTFLNLNSHHPFIGKDPAVAALRHASKLLGLKDCFKILFFSFLHSSFLYKKVEMGDLRKVAELLGIEPDRALLPLFKVGTMALTLRFRTNTSEFYFRHAHGIRESIFTLTKFDFLRLLDDSPRTLAQIDDLAGCFTKSIAFHS